MKKLIALLLPCLMLAQNTGQVTVIPKADDSATGVVRFMEKRANGSNYVDVTAPDSLTGNRTATLPDASITVVGRENDETLSGAKTFSALITATSGVSTGGHILPDADGTWSLGSSSFTFSEVDAFDGLFGGNVYAGLPSDGNGYARLTKGDAGHTGTSEYHLADGTRLGYVGFSGTDMSFTAENGANFLFTGGNILPDTNGTRDLGSASYPFGTLYVTSCTGCAVANMMTTDTTQTVTGSKTFSSANLTLSNSTLVFGSNAYISGSALPVSSFGVSSYTLGDSTHRWANTWTVDLDISGSVTSTLYPGTTATYDIGATGARWRRGYFSSDLFANRLLTPSGTVQIGGDPAGGIEIGRQDGTPSSPYIDFHTDGSTADYNARLSAYTGGIQVWGDLIPDVDALREIGTTGSIWAAVNAYDGRYSTAVYAGLPSDGNGYARLVAGDATHTGTSEYALVDGTRLGYIGYSGTDMSFTAENGANFLFSGGNILPDTNGTRNIGSTSRRFGALWVNSCTGCAPTNMMTTDTIQTVTGSKTFSSANVTLNSSTLVFGTSAFTSGDILPTSGGGISAYSLGDATHQWAKVWADDLSVVGAVTTALIPETAASYDLGSSTYRWRRGYFSSDLFANRFLTPSGTIQLTSDPSGAIEIGRQDGTAAQPYIDFHTDGSTTDYNVRLSAYTGGLQVWGDLIPDTNGTRSLGSVTNPFAAIYVNSCTGCAPANYVTTNTTQTISGQKTFSSLLISASLLPVADAAYDIGNSTTARMRRGYFTSDVFAARFLASSKILSDIIEPYSSGGPIDVGGTLLPVTDAAYDLGNSSTLRWRRGYFNSDVFASRFLASSKVLSDIIEPYTTSGPVEIGGTVLPSTDATYDLGNSTSNRFRRGHFTSDVTAARFLATSKVLSDAIEVYSGSAYLGTSGSPFTDVFSTNVTSTTATSTAFVAAYGAPSAFVAAKGYSFGGGGDTDGGMFSSADGEVGLYVNGVQLWRVSASAGLLAAAALTPTTSGTYDLGGSGARWNRVYSVDASFTGTAAIASATISTLNVTGSVGSAISTQTVAPSINGTYDSGGPSLRWNKVWGIDASFTGTAGIATATITTANVATLNVTTCTGCAPANYVTTNTPQTITGTKLFSATVAPSASGTYDLGGSGARWNRVYSVDASFTGNNVMATATITNLISLTGVTTPSGFAGVTASVTCPSGQAIKGLTTSAGWLTGYTCGTP